MAFHLCTEIGTHSNDDQRKSYAGLVSLYLNVSEYKMYTANEVFHVSPSSNRILRAGSARSTSLQYQRQ